MVLWSRGLSPVPFLVSLVLQLGVLAATRAAVTAALVAVSKHEGAFLRYGAMLRLLENLSAQAPELQSIRERLQKGGVPPSASSHSSVATNGRCTPVARSWMAAPHMRW